MKKIYTSILSSCIKVISVFLFVFPLAVNAQQSMRANLYIVDATGATLVDGNLTNYNSIYSNSVDSDDGLKLTNPGINFGILREEYNLVVEMRNIIGIADTTFFRMWNLPQLHYQIKFMLSNLNHPGLEAVVKDNYLNTEFPVSLNGTTYYDFTVDANTASADQMRFQFIYTLPPVDVNFTEIKAQRNGKDVFVEWEVSNEIFMSSYTVEHSADGVNFDELSQRISENSPINKTYNYMDMGASSGNNYYRIKAISKAGKIQYSQVAKVDAILNAGAISIYPNPVRNKTVQFQFGNLPAGKYSIKLLYNNGASRYLSSIQLVPGQSNYSATLPKHLSPGFYWILFVGPDNIE